MVSGFAKNIVVAAGQVAFLRKGQPGQLKAPNLTVCSAILLKGKDKDGAVQGFLMGHRQPQDFDFKKNLMDVVKDECQELTWEVVAVQTANDPTIQDGEINSTHGLAQDVAAVLRVPAEDVVNAAEKGVSQSFGVNQMIVEIDKTGKEIVQRRKGIFSECTVM